MKNLVQQVAEKFNGNITSTDTVEFVSGEDKFCLTDDRLYAVTDDGDLLPGCSKVRNLKSVEKFIALRA